jgi:hypothetical protein
LSVIDRSKRPILGLISLLLAIATPILLLILLIGSAGTLVASPRDVRTWPIVIAYVVALSVVLSPITALGAVVTGHIARRRDKDSAFARAGLILGYIWVALLAALGIISYLIWQTISPSTVQGGA